MIVVVMVVVGLLLLLLLLLSGGGGGGVKRVSGDGHHRAGELHSLLSLTFIY